MDINEIFKKWIDLTEVNPESTTFTINKNNSLVYNFNEEIKTAINTDTSGGYDATIVLKKCFYEYLDNSFFSIKSILFQNKECVEKMKIAKILETLLNEKDIIDYEKEFKETIAKISHHYNIDEKIKDLTDNDKIDIILNSKKAIKFMNTVQFKKGKFAKEKPKLINNIHMFYNINDLLNIVVSNEKFNGITLNCIVDKTNNCYSYFCFLIKNGENIYMISDKPIEKNISKKFSGRAQGREFSDRICKFLFPYELLNMEINKYYSEINTNLSSISNKYDMIGTLLDCSAASSLWISYCIEILYNMFFVEIPEEMEIFYTGGMINILSLEKTETTLALQGNYELIDIEKNTIESVIKTDLNYNYPACFERFHANDWVVEKYKDKINENTLNLKDNIGQKEISVNNDKFSLLCFDENIVSSKEGLNEQIKWIARNNMAIQIDELYKKDVASQLSSLHKWYLEKLSERKDFLKKIIAEEECILTKYEYTRIKKESLEKYQKGEILSNDDFVTFGIGFNSRKENVLKILNIEEDKFETDSINLCNIDKNYSSYRSYFNNKPASYIYKITINSAQSIAEILGLNVSDLPELLQHYTSERLLSEGNCILEYLDPFEYAIKNNISKFSSNIKIYLSKTDIKEIKKQK